MPDNLDPLLPHQLARLYHSLDISAVLAVLIRITRTMLPVDQAAIVLWDRPRSSFWVIDLATQDMETLHLSPQPNSFGHLQRRAEDRSWPHWTHHYFDPNVNTADEFFAGQPCATRLCVDLGQQDRHIGLFYVGCLRPDALDNQASVLLSRIAEEAAGAIGHAWQHELLRRRIDSYATLVEIHQAITSPPAGEKFSDLVAVKMTEVLGVAASIILGFVESPNRLDLLSKHITPFGKAIRLSTLLEKINTPTKVPALHDALRTGRPVTLNSSHKDMTATELELLTSCGCETLVALPLRVEDRSVGLALLLDRRYRECSPDDLELVQAMAQQVATMLEREQLLTETVYLQEFSERVFEAVRDIIYVHDMEGRLTLVNQRAVELIGYERLELIGMNIQDLAVPADREKVMSLARSPTEGTTEPFEISILTKEGTEIPVQVNASPLYEGKRMVGVVGVLRDQREQRRWQERLVRDERLRALGQMAGSVAHDFNNLLAVVMGRVQLALRETEGNRELRMDLEAILEAAQEGARTVRRIQSFTRKRTDRLFMPVDVGNLIREAVELTRSQLERHAAKSNRKISLSLSLQPVPAVAAAESELRETLVYLIYNAIEAMPNGGNITLSSYCQQDQVIIQVVDNGVGIPRDVLPHVFEPFYTTRGPQHNGLGLSTAYGTITRYGGEIDIASEEGAGTTVTVRLPVSPIDRVSPDHSHQRASRLVDRKLRILVVEDEAPVRNLVAKMLRSDGHHVVTKPDGTTALESFASQPFDIVFTDLGMPGLSGWEVTQRIRAQNATVPVILVTGWGTEVEEEKLHQCGVTQVITKPFRLEEIQACLAKVS